MKILVLPTIIVMSLCGAWMLYLRWDTQRFVESLPEAPSRTHTKPMPQERLTENENSQTPPPERVAENNASSTEGLSRWDATEDLNPSDTSHTDPADQKHDPVSGIDVEQKTEDKLETQESDENSRHPAMDLSLEQIVENNRRRLIEQHGNIPEVDIYIHHMMPVFKGITEGKQELTVQRTPEEALEYSKAQAVLFPTQKNIQSYQNVLKTTQHLKRRKQLKRSDPGK